MLDGTAPTRHRGPAPASVLRWRTPGRGRALHRGWGWPRAWPAQMPGRSLLALEGVEGEAGEVSERPAASLRLWN